MSRNTFHLKNQKVDTLRILSISYVGTLWKYIPHRKNNYNSNNAKNNSSIRISYLTYLYGKHPNFLLNLNLNMYRL